MANQNPAGALPDLADAAAVRALERLQTGGDRATLVARFVPRSPSSTLRHGSTASRRDKHGERARPDRPPQALVESVSLVHQGVALVG